MDIEDTEITRTGPKLLRRAQTELWWLKAAGPGFVSYHCIQLTKDRERATAQEFDNAVIGVQGAKPNAKFGCPNITHNAAGNVCSISSSMY